MVERTDKSVTVAILGSGDGRFRLDDGVDTTDWAHRLDITNRDQQSKGKASC